MEGSAAEKGCDCLHVYHCCSGFPPALQQLKSCISQEFPGLPKENPGSLWPKTSLGAMKDDRRLTPDQLQGLNEICK